MRKIIGIVCLLACPWALSAQSFQFGHEWIKPDQHYYRIAITENGIYRVSFSRLKEAGMPVESIDPITLCLFRRGVEQTIRVIGEQDHQFDKTDTLEFMGERNDGALDTLLPQVRVPGMPSVSSSNKRLYNDTAVYFLTWRTDGSMGRRVLSFTDTRMPRLDPARLELVSFRDWALIRANYLLVTQERLCKSVGSVADPVRAYAAYRASAAGGSYDTLVVTMKELYDQFSFGEQTPLAIRRFANWMKHYGGAKFLFLLGTARPPSPDQRDPDSHNNLVPTIGTIPCSDVLLTAGLEGFPLNVPALATGRISVANPQQLVDYLEKVQAFESNPPAVPWRKRIVHLSGGHTQSERFLFRSILDEAGKIANHSFLGAMVQPVSKKTDGPVEWLDIHELVNQGISLLTFFGHSSPVVTDADLGYVSDPTRGYANRGRYPLLFFNGCGVGNIFYGGHPLSTDWLLTPGKGAIAVLAPSHSGYIEPLQVFTDQFYRTLLTDSIFFSQPIGLIHQEVTRRVLERTTDDYTVSNAQQMVLQGDPALRIFPLPKADFQLEHSAVFLVAASNDSVCLGIRVTNVGRYDLRDSLVICIQNRSELNSPCRTIRAMPVAHQDTLFYTLRPDETVFTPHRYEIILDPGNRVSELDETNNHLGFELQKSATGYQLILPDSGRRFPPAPFPPLLDVTIDGYPVADGALVSASPRIVITVFDEEYEFTRTDTAGIEVWLRQPCLSCDFERIPVKNMQIEWKSHYCRINYQPSHLPDGLITLHARLIDPSGRRPGSGLYEIRFRVQSNDSLSSMEAVPNPVYRQTTLCFTLIGQEPLVSATIIIRNQRGQVVRTLQQPSRIGENKVVWDGQDQNGSSVPTGLYVGQLILSDGRRRETKMLLIR